MTLTQRPVAVGGFNFAVMSLAFGIATITVAPAYAQTDEPPQIEDVQVGVTDDGWDLDEAESDELDGPPSDNPGQSASYKGPSYWTVVTTSTATQMSCFRPVWNKGKAPAGAETYGSRAEAVGSYTGRFPAWLGADGDMWRPGDYVPACVIEPGEDAPEPPSPLEVAMSAWHSAAVTVAPSVTVEPEAHDYTLVGLPTIIAIDDYAPPVDIDSNPRTITWSFGSIELRATAQHRFAWDDGGTGDTGWVSSNGREYVEGDETGVYADPQPFAHVYTEAGGRDVVIDVRWSGEWRNAGGAWEPLPVGPIFQSLTEPVDVQQRQAVLTD